jgi:hypothetical protein
MEPFEPWLLKYQGGPHTPGCVPATEPTLPASASDGPSVPAVSTQPHGLLEIAERSRERPAPPGEIPEAHSGLAKSVRALPQTTAQAAPSQEASGRQDCAAMERGAVRADAHEQDALGDALVYWSMEKLQHAKDFTVLRLATGEHAGGLDPTKLMLPGVEGAAAVPVSAMAGTSSLDKTGAAAAGKVGLLEGSIDMDKAVVAGPIKGSIQALSNAASLVQTPAAPTAMLPPWPGSAELGRGAAKSMAMTAPSTSKQVRVRVCAAACARRASCLHGSVRRCQAAL